MVEIKGFNEAYKNCVAIEAEKKRRRQGAKKKIAELVEQGVDKTIATVLIKTLQEADLLEL